MSEENQEQIQSEETETTQEETQLAENTEAPKSEPEETKVEVEKLKPETTASEARVQVKTKDIECRYCNDAENPDRVAHMVCIEMNDGHIHVHAPFSDRRAIYRFLDAIERELARHKRQPEAVRRGPEVIK